MIKYIIIKYTTDEFGGKTSEVKTTIKSKLKEHLSNGWVLHKKIIPIITPFLDWWKTLTNGNKIAFLGVIVSAFLIVLFWILDRVFDDKYNDLNQKYEKLDQNYTELNQFYILTIDSLKIEREKSEYLRELLIPKTDSYKKTDSLKID